jgi:uncharacterized protein YjbI with pentapeptide repeats
MANEVQLSILKQGVEVWNKWRAENLKKSVDLTGADLADANLNWVNLSEANLDSAHLNRAILKGADLSGAQFEGAWLTTADLGEFHDPYGEMVRTNLSGANLTNATFLSTNLSGVNLTSARLNGASLSEANLRGAILAGSCFQKTQVENTIFGNTDLSLVIGLEDAVHGGPSSISTDVFVLSKGKIPDAFLRGCGLSDWEVEAVKMYNPDLSNEEINNMQYKIYELRASQAIQISPLFISYSHSDSKFVDLIGNSLTKQGIRYWRDIHDMKAGRIETQIDRGIRQNPTVLLVLSEHSLSSDWVEHEVRTARGLEKDMGRDVLCPIALDDSWKSSPWPKRVMEQIMEYNILDFSAWKDDSKFEGMFRKLIDGLELFYKDKSHGE